MRHAARGLAALVAVTLALGAADAQARFRLRTGGFHASSSSVPRAPAVSRSAGVAVGPTIGIPVASAASVGAPYGYEPPRAGVVTRSVLSSAPPAEEKPREAAPKRETVVKVAEPWCPSGRIVGSGTGFCEIN